MIANKLQPHGNIFDRIYLVVCGNCTHNCHTSDIIIFHHHSNESDMPHARYYNQDIPVSCETSQMLPVMRDHLVNHSSPSHLLVKLKPTINLSQTFFIIGKLSINKSQ